MSLSTIWTFIKCAPELFQLIKVLEQWAEQAEEKRKIKSDVQTIKNAFQTKDPNILNSLFASK